jgi:hypothetical protein
MTAQARATHGTLQLTAAAERAQALAMASLQCQSCGAAVTLSPPIPRESSCESCRHDYHSCRQCRHYDTSRHNACRETQADMVEDKERRNFCEFFDFNPAPFRPGLNQARAGNARAKLEGLFGGSVPKPTTQDARARLDALFKKPESEP